jgi:hypothetical protein
MAARRPTRYSTLVCWALGAHAQGMRRSGGADIPGVCCCLRLRYRRVRDYRVRCRTSTPPPPPGSTSPALPRGGAGAGPSYRRCVAVDAAPPAGISPGGVNGQPSNRRGGPSSGEESRRRGGCRGAVVTRVWCSASRISCSVRRCRTLLSTRCQSDRARCSC